MSVASMGSEDIGELGSVDRRVEIDFESIPEHNELGWASPKAGLVASPIRMTGTRNLPAPDWVGFDGPIQGMNS